MNNFFKVLFYLLIAVYMNGCSSIQCKGVSTKEEAKNAIVKITSKNFEGTTQTGTGFVIAKHPNGKKVYIVTAAHVVMGDSNPKIEFFSQTSSFYEAEYKLWEKSDVAILWLDDLPPDIFSQLHTLCISKVDLEAGNEVFTYGFPEEEWHRHKKMDFELSKENTYIFGGNIKPGFSGGPLLFKQNKKWLAIATTKWQVVAMINKKGPTGEVIATQAQILLNLITQLDPNIIRLMEQKVSILTPTMQPPYSPPSVKPPINLSEDLPKMVSIKEDFEISKYEITLKQYKYFCDQTDRAYPKSPGDWMKDNMPVVNVSWDDAVAYTEWLSKETKETYRLPKRKEWTLAAQGGSGRTDYFWGYDSSEACQYANGDTKNPTSRFDCNDKHPYLAPVKSKDYEPNGFRLYHMLGNASEWTSECNKFEKCIVRGGSWMSLKPENLYILRPKQEWKKQKKRKTRSGPEIGFRVVKDN
ncbi:MAG: hypothetical protein DRR16_02745 [Candidatus Parabeggiatoa sp. nov. 3]|nr:MAG: hypothetical protein DRR00_05015 [Gammaproteobacteria bacterium]RKZ66081.1 MAG: hypothetical protein DRQ99_10790 [Gammaproteobacteria bacterium]RKZ89289.1 MAG: hypothetical protein DRR16_02745 [Gammaproteobacteria bacterium]